MGDLRRVQGMGEEVTLVGPVAAEERVHQPQSMAPSKASDQAHENGAPGAFVGDPDGRRQS